MKEKCLTEEGKKAHALSCLVEETVDRHMQEGPKKDAHAVRCLGESTFGGKMLEGPKKDAHARGKNLGSTRLPPRTVVGQRIKTMA